MINARLTVVFIIAVFFIMWLIGLYINFRPYKYHRAITRYECLTASMLMSPYNVILFVLTLSMI